MATSPSIDALSPSPLFADTRQSTITASPQLVDALGPLASLRLTVVLFAMAIFIVLAGTLGQIEMDMWAVMSRYFYRWATWIPVRIFFPPAWFPKMPEYNMRVIFAFAAAVATPIFGALAYYLPRNRQAGRPLAVAALTLGALMAITSVTHGAFFFPGGKAIGVAMLVNLLAAHAIRFKVQASGARFVAGLAVIAAGIVGTWFVIVSGHNPAGMQGVPFFEEWTRLWSVLKYGYAATVAIAIGATIFSALNGYYQRVDFWVIVVTLIPLSVLAIWLIFPGNDAYLGDSGMRILWQLIKALCAALILLAGCLLLFKRRGGIVQLHSGVLLMMFGQVFVSQYDVEEQLTIYEGQTVNYAQDIRAVELAVVDRNLPGDDQHDAEVTIPLVKNGQDSQFLEAKTIQSDQLPFDILIEQYFYNSAVGSRGAKADSNPATKGKGISLRAKQAKINSGTNSGGAVDQASAYVKFLDKESGADLGTYLLSQSVLIGRDRDLIKLEEEIEVGDKKYDVSLRYARHYKPYAVSLIDFRKDDYHGSTMVKNYSSDVYLVDESKDVDRKIHISMNNPLRYSGETFYQSSWRPDHLGRETTILSVVTNRGWMIPYVACMIVATGMLAHFLLTLIRFLRRLADEPVNDLDSLTTVPVSKKNAKRQKAPLANLQARPSRGWYSPTLVASLAAVLLGAYWISRAAKPVERTTTEMQIEEAASLPVLAKGRVKPLDTLARNSLRAISNRETFTDTNGEEQPAIRWLLDVISGSPAAYDHQVVRIDNLEVLDLIGLTRRKGNKYSISEIRPKIRDFEVEANKARTIIEEQGADELSDFQRKVVELDDRIRTFTLLHHAFVPPNLPPLPTPEEVRNDERAAKAKVMALREEIDHFMAEIRSRPAPRSVPKDDGQWAPYSQAWVEAFLDQVLGKRPPEALSQLNTILLAYADNDATAFNRAVADYQIHLRKNPPKEYVANVVNFEAKYNHISPFYNCSALYVLVFVLTALSWLTWSAGWNRPLNWAAFWLAVFIFLVHTCAIVARIYISGRPPVTNLYGSALFIGWACVLLGLLLEWFFRIGVGNAVAAVSGFATLLVAHFLADGDTMAVLQAVLDTQFWLATHVVCITLGYATTLVAGVLGVIYITAGVMTQALNVKVGNRTVGKMLTSMMYGTLCFSIFFSFVGTVLGGLWADDSWGRFWGWDPKENGALIIVLWNALVLHARWGAIVKDRGLAVLVVAGNIAVAWSWFGVNELGVGLHSYGFSEGMLMWLGIFVASQLMWMALGCLPKQWWQST